MVLKPETRPLFSDREKQEAGSSAFGLWPILARFAGLLALTSILGFIVALTTFMLGFMVFRAGKGIVFASTYTAAGITFICLLASLLNRDFPRGLLQSYVDLPRPLG